MEPAIGALEAAGLELLQALDRLGYDFVPVTPETHRRVVARSDMRRASDLRGAFGWSLPFARDLLPSGLFDTLVGAGLIEQQGADWRAAVRVSRVCDRLYLHSAFPTDRDDSIFLGPDSLRFCRFIGTELEAGCKAGRVVDIGAGAGVGGIAAAAFAPGARIELGDLNRSALALARINASHAGVEVEAIVSDGLGSIAPGFDLAVANPPYIIDESGPTYRAGGGSLGAEISLRWARQAARMLAPGGRLLLYTGSAIVAGRDLIRETLEAELPALGCSLNYREIDPDVFGEELEKPAYAKVERIAAVGAAIRKGAPG